MILSWRSKLLKGKARVSGRLLFSFSYPLPLEYLMRCNISNLWILSRRRILKYYLSEPFKLLLFIAIYLLPSCEAHI